MEGKERYTLFMEAQQNLTYRSRSVSKAITLSSVALSPQLN